MKIKFKRSNNLDLFKRALNQNFFFKFYFFSTIVIFILSCLIFFKTGTWENNKKEIMKRIHLNGIINYKYLPEIIYYKINSIFEKQKKIFIDINQKNILKIENNRQNILDFQKEEQIPFKHVVPFEKASAYVLYDNKRFRSEIRLKGDRRIHFENKENSSYRIDMRKNEVFNEMKKFSIQKPRIRNYLHEWIFHELLAEGNLIKAKYDFYDFYLNGKNLGYYSVEESFGKVMLERNKRRNGPIFSIFEEFSGIADDIKFEVYNKKFWEDDKNISIVRSALSKMNKFLAGEETLENTFDVERWAWFFAVTDLTYTYHGMAVKSVKFYFNPINGKFEPIGFDGHRFLPNYSKYILKKKPKFNSTNFSIAKNKNLKKEIYSKSFWTTVEKEFFYQNDKLNQNFYKAYVKAIKRVSSKNFLDEFFKSRKKKIKKINSGIYSDSYIFDYNTMRKSGIGIYFFSKDEIYRRAEFLLKEFSVNIYGLFIEEGENKIVVNNYNDNNIFLVDGKIICENYEIDLGEFNIQKKISFLDKDEKFNNSCKKVVFRDFLSGRYIEKNINRYNHFNIGSKINKNVFWEFFVSQNNELTLKNKVTKIDKDIFIPEGYQVIIKGGEKIIFENNSFIFSNANWIVGDLNNKTSIRGTKENPGGGIIIYDNKKKSSFQNCEFEYLTGLKGKDKSRDNYFINERIIMGSINFFQTDVLIENSSFKNLYSEDAINIVSSNYMIKETFFENVKSDAVDIDFSDGKISKSVFLNIGNDAIDFSGSNSDVQSITFKKVGDKGISVGENSSIKISSIIGETSLVGIATKDGSITHAKDINFKNIDYPFAAYQKKKAYKFGELYLNDYSAINFKKEFIKDFNSIIVDIISSDQLGKNNEKIDKIIENII